jgi:hypothetical protein
VTQDFADKFGAFSAIVGVLMCCWAIGMILYYKRREANAPVATPVTDEGLTQYDDLPPAVAVMMAWSEAGDNPRWHALRQDDVRAEMPVLARALDRLSSTDS